MGERGLVTRTLLAIARAAEEDGDGDDKALATRICRACTDGLDVDGAAMSVLTATDARLTLAATDPTAQVLEDLQFSLNEGACIEAAETGAPVLVVDVHEATQTARWPLFAAAVRERTPVRGLFALPLRWGGINLGVLDLYRRVPGTLAGPDLADAVDAADTAALMFLGRRTDPGGAADGWIDAAVGSRAEVYQATGMVLVQLGVSAPEALARLRGYAFAHDQLLIDVAKDVVAGRLTFGEEMR